MASAEAVVLSAIVTTRHGGASSRRLIELTNYAGSASAIDSDVLDAACDDALGKFRIKTGMEPDVTLPAHTSALIPGVLYYLELYKGRDTNQMQFFSKAFFGSLKDIADRIYHLAKTTSTLDPSTETANARPDMDRKNNVFSGGRRVAKLQETWKDE